MKENKVHRVSLSILKLFISRPNTSLSFSMCVSAVFHGSQYPRRGVCHRALLGFRIPGRRSKGPRIQSPRSKGPRVQVQSPGPRVQGQRVQGLRFQGSRVLVQGPRVQGSKGPGSGSESWTEGRPTARLISALPALFSGCNLAPVQNQILLPITSRAQISRRAGV